MTVRIGTGRRISELFFNQESNDNVFICKCGVRRKKAGSSYANLVSHVRSAHPDYAELLSSDRNITQTQIDRFFNTTKAARFFGWFDLIINALLPFSFVEKKVVREHVKHDPMSLSTFMRYLPLLTELVENKIADLLPPKIALVFDGWTAGTTHYFAVFASFPSDSNLGYDVRLLAFSPMGDECHLNAEEHVKFITYILGLYEKTWDDVCCIIGDNCNTNKAVANNASVALIGCASHRFNLAVQDLLAEEEMLISKINCLMVKLRTLLLSAQLLKLTPLRPKTRNTTRWSSSFEMVSRYMLIKEFLRKLDSDEVDNLCPTPAENRRIEALLKQLKVLESVTKMLQEESTSVSDVRAMFDAVIEEFPETTDRLTSSAEIVHSPLFESAVVKVQRGNSSALSREERAMLSSLELVRSGESSESDDRLSFAQRALKRQKTFGRARTQNYMDSRFLLPTSNICERLFSKAGHVLTDRRKGLSPVNLESQIFLHLNNDLWGTRDINKITQDSD